MSYCFFFFFFVCVGGGGGLWLLSIIWCINHIIAIIVKSPKTADDKDVYPYRSIQIESLL